MALKLKSKLRKITRWNESIGYQEREIFEAFLALPPPQRKIVREVILTFAKATAATEKSPKKI